MREIKFRAWDGKRMLDRTLFDRNWYCEGGCSRVAMPNDQRTLITMQFTGLKDINDTDIYEGDLIKNKSGRICKVVWRDGAAMFDATVTMNSWKDTDSVGFKSAEWPSAVEVVGNIHENKELLN